MTESDGEMLARIGTDARLWAHEFQRIHGFAIDFGVLVTWFANAIEAGRLAP